jgi:hypothetical protein
MRCPFSVHLTLNYAQLRTTVVALHVARNTRNLD